MSSSGQLGSESSKKVMYPLAASTSSGKGSRSSPPKAHHMPKSSLPKHHTNQMLPNNNNLSLINPHQYYSLRWNNYQK